MMSYRKTGSGGGGGLGSRAASELAYEQGLLVIIWLEEGAAFTLQIWFCFFGMVVTGAQWRKHES